MMDRDFINLLFKSWAAKMMTNRDYLIDLDSIVGDGDLGLTMSDGFAAAANQVCGNPETDLGKVFYFAGKTMSQAVPSTMGTLVASGFMSIGKYAKGLTSLDLAGFAGCMQAFYEGIQKLGKAEPGEKTILDGLFPAIQVLKEKAVRQADWQSALNEAAEAARLGFASTREMVAVHGRAATRGENSRSLQDPGAAVAMLLLQTVAELSGKLSPEG